MPHLLIYSCPVDHHSPAEWYRYRDRIADALGRAGVANAVATDDEPLFTYGVRLESTLARVNATHPAAREVLLAQWSTIVFYSASVLFLGDGVRASAVRSALRSEPLLKEHTGEYTLHSGSCYAYELYPPSGDDAAATRRIVECVPDGVYVGPPWMVNDADGADDARFEIVHRGADGVAFKPRVAGIDEEIWDKARSGDGLAVLSASDPRLPAALAATDIADELTLFIDADAARSFPRVTIGRCHMDDTYVCLYNHPYVEETSLRLVV